MELTESVEEINKQLVEHFGIDTESTDPIWRVSWSEDQFEWRHGTYDDYVPGTKIWLRQVTETRWVPKYRQWVHEKYVLERLVIVPDHNILELPATKKSYENIYTFEDKNGNYLPPKFEAAKFVIDLIYAVQYGTGMKRYSNPDGTNEAAIHNQRVRIDKLVEELFGEQSSLEGTTKTGESIIVPRNYERK